MYKPLSFTSDLTPYVYNNSTISISNNIPIINVELLFRLSCLDSYETKLDGLNNMGKQYLLGSFIVQECNGMS
jgi:hypothetical protein